MNDNIKILVVDDEEDILEFLSYNYVLKVGDVIVADNGILAIELAKQEQPSLSYLMFKCQIWMVLLLVKKSEKYPP